MLTAQAACGILYSEMRNTETTKGEKIMSNTTETTYSVVVVRNMYQPDLQGKGNPAIVRSQEDDSELTGLTPDEAREIVADLDDTVYMTANDEAGRPEYFILSDDDAGYYTNGRNQDGGNYDWDIEDCESRRGEDNCGECSGCIESMRSQDCAKVRELAIK